MMVLTSSLMARMSGVTSSVEEGACCGLRSRGERAMLSAAMSMVLPGCHRSQWGGGDVDYLAGVRR